MTAPILPAKHEVMASMDDTHDDPQPEPSGGPGPEAASETTAEAVSESAAPAPQPAPTHSPASADLPQPAARRIDAGNTALLIGIIVGLIGSVSVLFGVPVFLLNEEVNRVGDEVASLRDEMNARFAAQDTKIENRFNAQDTRIENRFNAQDTRIENRFDAQDTKIDELQRGVSEIDRKLAALIASLDKTGTAGRLEHRSIRPVDSPAQQWNTPVAEAPAAIRHITSAHSPASDGLATMLMSSASHTANRRPASSAST